LQVAITEMGPQTSGDPRSTFWEPVV
jgi:hypothetical protein